MRNVLAKVSKGHDEMVAATIRTIFARPPISDVMSPYVPRGESSPHAPAPG